MACYDCEDCPKHRDGGGKCTRFEYTCPFRHLKKGPFNTQEEINADIDTAKELKNEMKQLLEKYEV